MFPARGYGKAEEDSQVPTASLHTFWILNPDFSPTQHQLLQPSGLLSQEMEDLFLPYSPFLPLCNSLKSTWRHHENLTILMYTQTLLHLHIELRHHPLKEADNMGRSLLSFDLAFHQPSPLRQLSGPLIICVFVRGYSTPCENADSLSLCCKYTLLIPVCYLYVSVLILISVEARTQNKD